MITCPCGWTVISPQGEDQAVKHILIHLHDIHPETSVNEAEIRATVKTV
ncbi:MAG: hypothetical protein HY297_05325 [Thaumarchaeota archaeon]|nr:hypothetical protein [Nitrososphaerota archaeon]